MCRLVRPSSCDEVHESENSCLTIICLVCNHTFFWSGHELGLGHCLKCPSLLYHAIVLYATAKLHFEVGWGIV